jgi:molybdopterin converting factor small subunit
MKIKVKLIGPLIYETGFSEKEIEMAGAPTVEAVLALLAISTNRPKIITRNGKAVAPHELLENGDTLAISPIYSGG